MRWLPIALHLPMQGKIAIEGEPPEGVRVATDCGRWLAESRIPKLFINAEPGAILTTSEAEKISVVFGHQ
jgi:hypothetical protein